MLLFRIKMNGGTNPKRRVLSADRLKLWFSGIALIPLGYIVRFYGPGPAWLNDALGSVAYEMFWIALFLGCWPKTAPAKMASWVFVVTCGLEVLQLWQPPIMQALRATLPGRLVLGNTFSWTDFPAYSVGCVAGFLWTRLLGALNR